MRDRRKIGSMLKCLIALTSLLAAPVLQAQIWTWVDAQGVRHYSDTPVDGATELSVERTRASSGLTLGSGLRESPQNAGSGEAPAASGYSVLDVISPGQEETFWNIGGELPVELAVYPPLELGHRIDAVLDDEYVTLATRSLSLTIPGVWRGEHRLEILIVDVEGNELMRSPPVTFFVQQTSIQ